MLIQQFGLNAVLNARINNDYGMKCIHLAAMHGREALIKLLLELGNDVDAKRFSFGNQ